MLRVDGLTVEFESSGYLVRPLNDVTVAAADGDLVVLLGPSGCGKTTMLSCLAGLLTPTAGRIRFADVEVTALAGKLLSEYRRQKVGIVFQAFNLVRSLSARENVMAPMLLCGVSRRRAGARADELLKRTGLSDRARHRPGELSGGQQQRVAIARALVNDPPLLLADEPTAHLDYIQVDGILDLLRELAAPGRVVLVSTHDDRITRLADRVIELAPRGNAPMATEISELRLSAGDLLFSQGQHGELVYVVEEGQVELFRVRADRSEEPITTIGERGYFGELAPLLGLPRSASARALCDTRLTGYPLHEFSRRFPSIRAGGGSYEPPPRTATWS